MPCYFTVFITVKVCTSGIYYSIKDKWEQKNVGVKMPLPHLVLLGGVAGVIGSYVGN